MSQKVKQRILILLFMVVVSQRTTLVSAQQEEKFFHHADFKESDRQAAESKADHLPVFPDGPLHVSLGLRALSGDNRPPHFHSEAVASSNAQEWQMTTPNPLEAMQQETLMPGRQLSPGKRQRRPGRRRRKRPTSTEPTMNRVEEETSFSESSSRPIPGEPSYDFRVSAEERDTTSTRPERKTTPLLAPQLNNYKLHRKPYSMVRKDSESESTNSNSRSDLKSLLKQAGSGGPLSLSEVLQQKNISLADLLNKKQHALAALSKAEAATTTRMDLNSGEMMMTGEDDKDPKKQQRRVPMFVAMPPHVYPTEELRPPPPQTAPTISGDSSPKRIPIFGPNVQSKPIKEVVSRIRPDFSNSKRPTTEGSHNSTATNRPNRWKSSSETRVRSRHPVPSAAPTNQSPSAEVITERRPAAGHYFHTERPSAPQTTGLPPNYLSSPASNIQFENLKNYRNRESFKEETTTTTSPEDRINSIEREADKANREVATIEDLFKYNPRTDGDRSKNRIEADLIERVIQNTQRALIESSRNGAMKDVTERNPGLFMDITSEKTVDDKTDLLELLTDRRNGAKLSKLLEQRNMTLDELVEHRRRGSSQLHLLEILNNRLLGDRQGKAKAGASGLDVVTAFDNFPQFSFANLRSVRPDEVKTDSQGSSYFASVFNVRPTEDRPRFRHRTTFDQLGRGSQGAGGMSVPQSRVAGSSMRHKGSGEDDDEDEERNFVEEPMNMRPVDIDPTQIPVGVRSAIIASTSIVVVCVMIFILIFIVFRYRQRRKRKLQYAESFRGARARFPIIDRDCTSKRSTSPMVYQTTLGTNSSRLSSKLHSLESHQSLDLPDYLFESMKSY